MAIGRETSTCSCRPMPTACSRPAERRSVTSLKNRRMLLRPCPKKPCRRKHACQDVGPSDPSARPPARSPRQGSLHARACTGASRHDACVGRDGRKGATLRSQRLSWCGPNPEVDGQRTLARINMVGARHCRSWVGGCPPTRGRRRQSLRKLARSDPACQNRFAYLSKRNACDSHEAILPCTVACLSRTRLT